MMLGNHASARRRLHKGFTLIELLVVITIITLLISLLMSGVQRVREAANRVTCLNNLKELALAAFNHHDAKGKFPTGFHGDTNGTDGASWESELLPDIEQGNLKGKLDDFNSDDPNLDLGRGAPTAQIVKLLQCPSDRLSDPVQQCPACDQFYAVGHYGGNAGRAFFSGDKETRDGIFFTDSKIRVRDITDGLSNTFLFGERSHQDKTWDAFGSQYADGYWPLRGLGKWANFCYPAHHMLGAAAPINYRTPRPPTPDQIRDRVDAFGSGHPGGANFAFGDGSVRFLSDQMKLATLQALSTRNGGEVVIEP